jgi:nitroreductase
MRHFILPLGQTYLRYHQQGRDVLFYDAPAVLIFHHSPYTDPAETYIACTYAMLAAESLGLGSTMIGAAAPVIAQNRTLCRSLGIPDGNKPAIALILGYPSATFRRTVRRSFSSVNEIRA